MFDQKVNRGFVGRAAKQFVGQDKSRRSFAAKKDLARDQHFFWTVTKVSHSNGMSDLIHKHGLTILAFFIYICFNSAPVFERRGGISRAKKVSKDELDTLIDELNYAIAA